MLTIPRLPPLYYCNSQSHERFAFRILSAFCCHERWTHTELSDLNCSCAERQTQQRRGTRVSQMWAMAFTDSGNARYSGWLASRLTAADSLALSCPEFVYSQRHRGQGTLLSTWSYIYSAMVITTPTVVLIKRTTCGSLLWRKGIPASFVCWAGPVGRLVITWCVGHGRSRSLGRGSAERKHASLTCSTAALWVASRWCHSYSLSADVSNFFSIIQRFY